MADESSKKNTKFDEIEILVPTRDEAETVLETMQTLVEQYEAATVADLYTLVALATHAIDHSIGWKDLAKAAITPARGGGWYLTMPRAVIL